MRKSFFPWIVTVLFALSFHVVNAQSKEEKKYREESEEMRKQVWAWKMPEFQNTAIPAAYANASKVIIARHTELTASSKRKLKLYGNTLGKRAIQTISEIARERVKINDKTSIEEYSELSFTQLEKTSGFYAINKSTSYVGIRVIKPDGSIKEINADDIVLTKDESTEKKARVAIPDLQPGDILDYFIAADQSSTDDYTPKPYHLFFFDDAPIISLSFHAELGKKYFVDYHSYNGAPDLSVSNNDDDETIIDIKKSNIPAFETELWITAARQLPFISMTIGLGFKNGQVTKITDGNKPFDIITGGMASLFPWGMTGSDERRDLRKFQDLLEDKARQTGTKFSKLTEEEQALLTYYVFRFSQMMNFDIDDLSKTFEIGNYTFTNTTWGLYRYMRYCGIHPSILISTTRNSVAMNDVMDITDLTTSLYWPQSNQVLSLRSVYDIPYELPDRLEGLKDAKLMTLTDNFTRAAKTIVPCPTLPINSADKNAHIENLRLALAADKTKLSVQRSTTLKGSYKADEQKKLILYEDLYESERKAFNEEKSLIEELEDHRKSRKTADEVKNAFAEARKKQKDAFLTEAQEEFDQEIIDLKDYKTENLGIRHTAPDFVYSSSFDLAGLVKKAGNNIIVDIGKIQGKPLTIKPDQRKRDIDVYMPFARSIEYNIELQIPDGYTADGVSALNKKVSNETGFFTVEATATDKLVIIKVKKHYLHNFEPASNWDKLLQFIDAANDWENSKLLFKKK